MTTRRLALLVLAGLLLLLGTASEQAAANDVEVDCALVAKTACANEGGCRLYQQLGCNCRFVCESGAEGYQTCGR